MRLVVHTVEGAGRYTVDSRDFDAGLHENVEHACGKLPAKTAALQDERDLAGVLCLIFCSHIDLLRLRFGFLLPSFGTASAQVLELRGRGSRRKSASRSQSKFRVAFSAEPVIRKMNPIPSLDSGTRFPLELPLGKHVPLYGSIPGRSFRLRRHPETTSQSERGFRDGLSAWAAIGKACPGLR